MQIIESLTRKSTIFVLLSISVMLLVFVADLQFTTEIYIGTLYIIVILFSLWLPNTTYTWIFASLATGLATIGYFNSIYNFDLIRYFTVNNFINLTTTIIAIWSTTIIAVHIKNISSNLKTSETIHRAILSASIDPIVTINHSGIIASASHAVEKTFGWSAEEIIGKKFEKLLAPNSRDKYIKLFNNPSDPNNATMIGSVKEIIGQHRMKREFPCELSINYIYISDLNLSLYTGVFRDISMRKATEGKMEWLSNHDELTKIYNRRFFNEQIEYEWKRLLRCQEPLGIIIIDVDFFKNYNDYLGHQTGDLCLQKIATSMELIGRRSTDFVARYGGEEFVVLLPGTDLDGAQQVADNLQSQIRALNIPHPNSSVSKQVTVSIGVAAMTPTLGCSYERLIRFADRALYQAKETGRNKYCIFQE